MGQLTLANNETAVEVQKKRGLSTVQFRPCDPSLWSDLFRECKTEAFHLEVQDSYGVPEESERLRRFLNGEPAAPDSYKSHWVELMREVTSRGATVNRVRVVTVPHTDYHRWLLSVTGTNIAAGEDIRYLPRHLAGEVPPDDWWLIDNERVAYNLVDQKGAPAGLAVTTDQRVVDYCRSVQQRLWDKAIPSNEYVDRVQIRQ